MDNHSAELLIRLVDAQVLTLRAAGPADSTSRGSSLRHLVDQLTSSAESQAHDLMARLTAAAAEDRVALGRKLSRCRVRLDVAHMLVSDYGDDVTRTDMPTGLLCLIDVLVSQLLPNNADPLIHLNEKRMYSTLSLNHYTARLVNDPTFATDLGVVVFNLPALDPGNVLYSPILAHEVAHTLVNQEDLINELLAGADLAGLDAVFARHFSSAASPDAAEWKQRLVQWLQELVCDAIATRLSGPSFLLASAAFLPASSLTGSLSSHPYPVDRLDLCKKQLERMGWGDYLVSNYPVICGWLSDLSASAVPPTEPQEAFLREAIAFLADDIDRVASAHVDDPLDLSGHEAIEAPLGELIAAGVPPSRIEDRIPTAWDLVLAGWQSAISSRGDQPASISSAAEDKAFNLFLVKALEVARITAIWDEA